MSDTLFAGQILNPSNDPNAGFIESASAYCRLYMQTDGNLVMYLFKEQPPSEAGWKNAVWASHTQTTDGSTFQHSCIMQQDGNLVIYDTAGNPVWATGTNDNPGAYAKVQDDGNFVIYDSGNSPLWYTGTH